MNIQKIIKSSFLSFDKPNILPFPNEMNEVIKAIDWKDFLWQAFGFPIGNAKYSLLDGSNLYIDELPSGETKILKQNFSGQVTIGSIFLDKNVEAQFHYLISFSLILVKGTVMDISVEDFKKLPKAEYEKSFNTFEINFNKKNKIKNSWYFKYLYLPYSFLMEWGFFIIIQLLNLSVRFLMFILKKLTPL